jgi:hypothetical protein
MWIGTAACIRECRGVVTAHELPRLEQYALVLAWCREKCEFACNSLVACELFEVNALWSVLQKDFT